MTHPGGMVSAVDVLMPRLSAEMEAGTILKWLVPPGAAVARGQEIVEIEADKAAGTHAAEAEGWIELLAAVGDTLPVGAAIARIVEEPGAAAEERRAPAAPADPVTAKGPVTLVELSRTEQVVVRRVAEAKATVPEITLATEVDGAQAAALRAQLDAVADAPVPTTTDMVVRACALALRDVPRANGAYRDGRLELYERVNVGIAVPVRDSLVVPTIFDADRRTLAEIARATRAQAERARTGRLESHELRGATFTVADLGAHGITSFTPILNPPQAAALGVGAIRADGALTLTLTCDHRILYGATAARFLARVRERLENPVALL